MAPVRVAARVVAVVTRRCCDNCGAAGGLLTWDDGYAVCVDRGACISRALADFHRADPEYAEVDVDGQLALGIEGDQRAIPGLATPRDAV